MKNAWNKLSSFVRTFHRNKLFIAFLIILTITITIFNYELLVKDSIVYPSEEFEKFETFAVEHFEKIKEGNISEIPSNINYTFKITKHTVRTKYTASTEIPYFKFISVEVNQYLANSEIDLTRNYTENNYKKIIRFEWIIIGIIWSILVWFVFSLFCYIVLFINLIIIKFTDREKKEKRKKKKNEEQKNQDLSTLEKASEYFRKHKEENQDIN